jgi:hypothetical protein
LQKNVNFWVTIFNNSDALYTVPLNTPHWWAKTHKDFLGPCYHQLAKFTGLNFA